MGEAVCPESAEQVTEAVAWAVAGKRPLELVGGGSKRGLGRPVEAEIRLDFSRLAGVVAYEPEELVLTAGAGTPLREIERLLEGARQMLAFEPPDLGPLLGAPAGAGTLGGALSANLGGPRRVRAGAARDHFLGFQAVSGRGESFKAGGRVVKNVTGYDLCKLLAGSFGTLAALTEATLKVLPAPEAVRTVCLHGLDDESAIAALGEAMRSPHEVTGAAHLPAEVAGRGKAAGEAAKAEALTAIRLEGHPSSVAARAQEVAALVGRARQVSLLDDAPSRALWAEIRDVAFFVAMKGYSVWRLSVPPAEGAATAARLRAAADALAFHDWAGGLLWAAVAGADAAAETVRGAIGPAGGHATLIAAPAEVRARVAVFQPPPPPVAALARRLKQAFDPAGVLNPGRMYPGL